jgi:hypothetical protein
MQSFRSAIEPDAIRFGRPVDRGATSALFAVLADHRDTARLRRAIGQYSHALLNWTDGNEAMAIAHLWIAVEALTKVALRRECSRAETDADGLAQSCGIEIQALDGEVRRRIIFQGDAEAARKARNASDGFEHGYLDFGEVRRLAAETRNATAGYVREAVIELAGVPEPYRARLLSPRYAKPLNSWIVRYLRGTLVGDADDLAADGEAYPKVARTSEIQRLSLREDGMYDVSIGEHFSNRFNPAVEFRPTSFEVWGAREAVEDVPNQPNPPGGDDVIPP